MSILTFIAAGILGAIGRWAWGGRSFFGWKPGKALAYPLFLAVGVASVMPPVSRLSVYEPAAWAALVWVAIAYTISWIPGHGSYADAGASDAKDDEEVRPITAAVAGKLGFQDAKSVGYDCVGASVRYGLSTIFIAIVLAIGNIWMGGEYGHVLMYAPVGLLCGPALFLLSLVIHDPDTRWKAFELTIGFIITAFLTLI